MKLVKRITTAAIAAGLAVTMVGSMTAFAGEENANGEGGTIMFLSSVSSGPTYDAFTSILEGAGKDLGYNFTVVYGDPFNDPAGNLSAVKNGMTDDVKALISMQDGGIKNIMDEYPDLYVTGLTTTMDSIYSANAVAPELAENDHFLGTVAGDCVDAAKIGEMFAQKVIENGYKKVSTMIFPTFAYPEMAVKDAGFRAAIDAYNETAADEDKIEVVGEAHVLEFAPLDDSYFMESDHADLDCVVAICDPGFVYGTMISARDNGLISSKTKLLAVGYLDDQNFQSDIGGEGTVQMIYTAAPESILYDIALIDGALNGTAYADHAASEIIDAPLYIIDSTEDIQNVVEKSILGTGNYADCAVTSEELENVLVRFNPEATYAGLLELLASDQVTVERFYK